MKSLTFSCLICTLNLYFAQKLHRKAKFARGCWNRTKLLQTPKVAQKLPRTIRKGQELLERPSFIYSACAYRGPKFFDNGLVT